MPYVVRTPDNPGDLIRSVDQNDSVDNENYLKAVHEALETTLNAGWRTPADTWVYVSATSFKIVGVDRTAIYQKGTRLRCKQGGAYKYFAVALSAFVVDTTVTITGGNDFSLANAAITDSYYSYEESPQGYPHWFTWTPTYTGFSANPPTTARFCIHGGTLFFTVTPTGVGTSNSTAYTITNLPVTVLTSTEAPLAATYDNGAFVANGSIEMNAAGTLGTLYKSAHGVWTNTNGKFAIIQAFYAI